MAISKQEAERENEYTVSMLRAEERFAAAEECVLCAMEALKICKRAVQEGDISSLIKYFEQQAESAKKRFSHAKKHLEITRFSVGSGRLISRLALKECECTAGFAEMSDEEKATLYEQTRSNISDHICID